MVNIVLLISKVVLIYVLTFIVIVMKAL